MIASFLGNNLKFFYSRLRILNQPKYLAMIYQILDFVTIFSYVLVSVRQEWWPPYGDFKVMFH